MATGSGDKLARGAARAAFPPAGGNVSQERWDAMWEDEGGATVENSSGDTDASETGVPRADVGEVEPNAGS